MSTTIPRRTGINAGMTLLAASAVAASVTGTTNETALATVTVPALAMGLNGGVLIYSSWSYTNSANAKTPRIRFGGPSGTSYFSNAQTTTATLFQMHKIRNRGAVNSQVGASSSTSAVGVASGGALVTSAVDTSAAVDIVLSGQLALGSETLTLDSYEVWLLP